MERSWISALWDEAKLNLNVASPLLKLGLKKKQPLNLSFLTAKIGDSIYLHVGDNTAYLEGLL